MEDRLFDHVARLVATGSRRQLLAGLSVVLGAGLMRSSTKIAGAEGIVALGGTCTFDEECQAIPGPGGPMQPLCSDNGFASDGLLTCCFDQGSCCGSDADCCGDLRCFQWPDVCNSCQMPPFPIHHLGEACVIDADCIPYPPDVRCLNGLCARPSDPTPERRFLSDTEAAMYAAERLSELEVAGQFDWLYDQMHPDAQRIIPRETVIAWYEADFAPRGAQVAESVKVRIVPWTWEVTGETYAQTADVAYRQRFADGSVVGGEVRLVKDQDGNWSWFFGRDRAFVEDQIARFPSEITP